MNFSDLKKLIGENGRCIIVENDKPSYIIMTAEELFALQENKIVKPKTIPVREDEKSIDHPVILQAAQPPSVDLEDLNLDDLGIDELPE